MTDSEHIDRVFHIEEMKGELEELSDGQMIMGDMGEELPAEVEEQFLEHVLAFERAEQVQHKDLLAREGVKLPPADELTDEELGLKLIEVIHNLAKRHTFLENTNHLSDRELYAYLWGDVLDEWTPDLAPDNPMNWHLDMIGSGSDEHIHLWMKYYADEETRKDWAERWLDMEMPPHEDPPYDRDRHLPKPPPPENPFDDPVVQEAWCAESREKLLNKLAKDDFCYVTVSDEPLWWAPPLAAVWGIESIPGVLGWYAISGDLPTTCLEVDGIEDARAFLRVISRQWQEAADALERDEPPVGFLSIPQKDRPRAARQLRHRAESLEWCAGEDSMWEEE
ncbi:MAG: DUF4826 family protein [Armatimonadota bacterium]